MPILSLDALLLPFNSQTSPENDSEINLMRKKESGYLTLGIMTKNTFQSASECNLR